MHNPATIRARLESIDQAHVLAFFDRLDAASQRSLLDQLDTLDLSSIPRLIDEYVRHKPGAAVPTDLAPAPCYPRRAGSWDQAAYRKAGEDLIRAGKVAAFTVAGGQGTRLGFDGPKGAYPAGAVTRKPLFQCLADSIVAATRRYGAKIPWCIMTSPLNHRATVEYFEAHDYCGLDPKEVSFFEQGVMPSFDMKSGRLLLAERHEVATNPDGHGGSLRALHTSGALARLAARGVEHISYTQIDNPLVRVIDPTFIGLHATAPDSSAQMSSKMVAKANASEKVGVFCAAGGKVMVIEYSDMPEPLTTATNPDGSLRFNAGSIAVHMIGRKFVESLNASQSGGFRLPYHRAEKKVPFVDPRTGERIEPAAPNAVKLEAFVFDAIPLCDKSIVLETDRVEEFAPIKNAAGVDSAESCAYFQTERAARWLEAAGVKVARRADGKPDCLIELSPLTALWSDDLLARRDLPARIGPGEKVAL